MADEIGLSAMSYDLHKELSDKFGGAENWGYRTVDTLVRLPHKDLSLIGVC